MSHEKTPSAHENPARGHLFGERGLLSELQLSVLTPNIIGTISPPITLTFVLPGIPPFTLAQLPALHIDDVTDRVCLSATVCWQGISALEPNVVEFQLYRDAPATGTLIFQCVDTGFAANQFVTTSFSHVDFPVMATPGQKEVLYFLVVVMLGGTANFSGPITFTGAEIERNRTCNP